MKNSPTTADGALQGEKAVSKTGLVNLFLVYVIWGSTYLAIRVAVRQEGGFPPFALGALRTLVAGSILLAWGALRRQRVRLHRQEIPVLVGSGLLMWIGGNGLVMFAEQRAESGLAALLVATTPLWTVFIEALLDRRPPPWRLIVSLLLGIAGVGLLSAPALMGSGWADTRANVLLVLASLSWAAGSVWQSRKGLQLAPVVSSAYQHLSGGLAFVLLALGVSGTFPTPRGEAWLAAAYLIVFGSIVAFTAFVRTLRMLPMGLAMTYALVNPVVAVILGAIVLDERITLWTVGGAVLVLLSVAAVFWVRRGRKIEGGE